jgi:hypothetical protein
MSDVAPPYVLIVVVLVIISIGVAIDGMSDNAFVIISVLLNVVLVAGVFYRQIRGPRQPASVLIVDVLLIIVLVASTFHLWIKNFG